MTIFSKFRLSWKHSLELVQCISKTCHRQILSDSKQTCFVIFMCFWAILQHRNSSMRWGCAAPANTSTYQFTTHLGVRAFCITLITPSCRSVLPKTGAHQIRSRKKSKSSSCRVFESHFGSLSPFPGLRLCHVRLRNKSFDQRVLN